MRGYQPVRGGDRETAAADAPGVLSDDTLAQAVEGIDAHEVVMVLLTYALAVEGLVKKEAEHRPKDGQIFLEEWLAYGASRVPALADAMASGDLAKRGLVLVDATPKPSTTSAPAATVKAPTVDASKTQPSTPKSGATQEPRLFDHRGRASTITFKATP